MQRAIRTLLDPWGANQSARREMISSPIIDNQQAFIAPFTNHLQSITGWPDETLDLFTSEPGLKNEVYSQVDHVGEEYNAFSLSATFRNVVGDPINAILFAWQHYARNVSRGTIIPYPEFIAERELDYQTRIYRLVLDPTRRWIQKIAACGAAIPQSNSLAAAFNASQDIPLSQDNAQVNVPFHCVGFIYNDPALIRDFNAVVKTFNGSMNDGVRERNYIKLTPAESKAFNYRGYPRITHDMELEWWVDKETYSNIAQELGLLPTDSADIASTESGYRESVRQASSKFIV
ncbi:hypothetical protein [Endozoicomonas sp. ONNA1]|uniref:hypothetical protein n=1 Tax=Endozoicomonas sp. ONNA1 TaxID=2828740 RepID=UPI002149062D|nr:hypothetical protein [Endozoicomonas sp. ONNA1]